MTLRGPNVDDIRKIHSEVCQIVNQRLSITFLTITVFGAMLAWLTPKTTPQLNSEVGAWESERNATRATIDWRFTIPNAKDKLMKLYPVREDQ